MLGCDALTLKRKDTLGARGWPPWEAASQVGEDCHTLCARKRWLQLVSWLGGCDEQWQWGVSDGSVPAVGEQLLPLDVAWWGANHFHQEQDDSHKGISLYVMVATAAVVRTGWQLVTTGTATGQWRQPPLQESGDRLGRHMPHTCMQQTDNHFQDIENRFLIDVAMRKDFNRLQDASDKDASVRRSLTPRPEDLIEDLCHHQRILIFSLQGS